MNREAIYVAAYQLLQTMNAELPPESQIVTFERRLRHWDDVPAEQQPYLCLTQGSEFHAYNTVPQRDVVAIKPKIYVYVRTTGALDPGTIINPILDAVQSVFAAMRQPVVYKQTLGGLVEHARIDGQVETFEGTLGDQEVAFIPLELLVSTS